jgi:hypothetical protein
MDAFQQQDLPLAEAEGAHAEARDAWIAGLGRIPIEERLEALWRALDESGGGAYSAGLLLTVFRETGFGTGKPIARSLGQLAQSAMLRCSDRQVQQARRLAGRLLSVRRGSGLRKPALWSINWRTVWEVNRRSLLPQSLTRTSRGLVPPSGRYDPQSLRYDPQSERNDRGSECAESSGPPAASNPQSPIPSPTPGLPIPSGPPAASNPNAEPGSPGLPIPSGPPAASNPADQNDRQSPIPSRAPARTSNEPMKENRALITPTRSPKEPKNQRTNEFIGGPARSNEEPEIASSIGELAVAVMEGRKTPWRDALCNRQFRAEQRERIKAMVCIACGLAPDADWWVGGVTADLVIKFGWARDATEDPEDNLVMLLNEVDRRRQSDGENRIDDPCAWLSVPIRKRAVAAGMRFGKAP